MDPLSRFSSQIAFRSCPCNEPKKDCSVEHGKVELFIKQDKKNCAENAADRKDEPARMPEIK